ncbi:hypothetical protein EV715DRAFT_196710 [Schizophyllum commune]
MSLSLCSTTLTDETPCKTCDLHTWMHLIPADYVPAMHWSNFKQSERSQLPPAEFVYERMPSHWLEGRGMHNAPKVLPASSSSPPVEILPGDVLCKFDRVFEEVRALGHPLSPAILIPTHKVYEPPLKPKMVGRLLLTIGVGEEDKRYSTPAPPTFVFQSYAKEPWRKDQVVPCWVKWEVNTFSFVESRLVVAVMLYGAMSNGGIGVVLAKDQRWQPLIWLCRSGPFVALSLPLLRNLSDLVWHVGPSQWRAVLQTALIDFLVPNNTKQ